MGLDPTRKHRRTPFDYWYVAVAILFGVALVLWALFG